MQTSLEETPCKVCGARSRLHGTGLGHGAFRLVCDNCGDHLVSNDTLMHLTVYGQDISEEDRARIAHGVRMLRPDEEITEALMAGFLKTVKLPTALEKIDRLISFMAENFRPGQVERLPAKGLRAYLGCVKTEEVQWVIRQAIKVGVIEAEPGTAGEALTSQGWTRYEVMQRQGHGSTHAFMAMAFEDNALWSVFENHMQPAVKATGFTLMTTADAKVKKAGSIIARMKVEIRTSRFVVCDLSHGNQGAYWEAGFAEGLGRPVIYTCRNDAMTHPDPKKRPHFDTAQQLIVKWDPADPGPGMRELKEVIRATLPAEAKMEDSQPANTVAP